MRKIVVSQFVSLDGVIEDPVGIEQLGRGAWTAEAGSGDEGERFKVDEIMDSGAMLMVRKTHEGYAAPARKPTDGTSSSTAAPSSPMS